MMCHVKAEWFREYGSGRGNTAGQEQVLLEGGELKKVIDNEELPQIWKPIDPMTGATSEEVMMYKALIKKV